MILMLKDIPVYDIDSKYVLSELLCPGMVKQKRFYDWMYNRLVSNTNIFFQELRSRHFRNKSLHDINISTHSVSLSDLFWVKTDSTTCWEDINPNNPINPTWSTMIRLPGYKSKKWLDSNMMLKLDSPEDYYAYQYCKLLGINSQSVSLLSNKNDVIIQNFTTDTTYLEQCNCSGLLDANSYTDLDIINVYGKELGLMKSIADMYFIDVLIDNYDRHLGNFGLLRNIDGTFEFAPLYDFDCTFNCSGDDSYMSILCIDEFVEYREKFIDYCNKVISCNTSLHLISIIKERAKSILRRLYNGKI